MEKIIAKSYARLILAVLKSKEDVPEKVKPYIDDAIAALQSK